MNANFKSLKGRSSMTMTNLSGAARFDAQQFPTEQPARVRRFSTFAVCRLSLLAKAPLPLLASFPRAHAKWVLVSGGEFYDAAGALTPTRSNKPILAFDTLARVVC